MNCNTLKEGWIDFEDEMLKALEKIEEFYEFYRPRLPHNKPAGMDLKNSAMVSTIRNFGTGKARYDPELANGIVSDKKLSLRPPGSVTIHGFNGIKNNKLNHI